MVSMDPGGFWNDAEKRIFKTSIGASIRLVRLLQPIMPLITGNPVGLASERERPLIILWGRQDKVCFPGQADKAKSLFPHARLVWFDHCGHFPHWDLPEKTIDCILRATS